MKLIDQADGLLLDLDGVVYVGPDAVPGAVDVLRRISAHGTRVGYVTNNASRDAADVAGHIREFGIACEPGQVITSADVAADWLAGRYPSGSPVLVVGGDGLHHAVERSGLRVVTEASQRPSAFVQGFGPDVGWRQLAEATYALRDQVTWVATNLDLTVPTPSGIALGNGALVQALVAATGRTPDAVTGKPAPQVFTFAARRWGMSRPLVIGDRLDTDIAGARAAGIPSLLVLTGVTSVSELLTAVPSERPDYIGARLDSIMDSHPAVETSVESCVQTSVGRWQASVGDGFLRLSGDGNPVDALRAAAGASWAAHDAGMIFDRQATVDQLLRLLDVDG